MQTRSLFTVLILGLAAGVAYVQADDIAELEKLSAEQLTQVMLEVVKELYAHVDSETQLKGKLQLIAEFPQFPELNEFVPLPFNQFLDEVSQVLIEKLPEESSSEIAETKKEIIAFVKVLKHLAELEKLAEESDE